jgi:hypothetical protein
MKIDVGRGQDNVSKIAETVYYTSIVAAFCANMIVVSQTTSLSVLGAGSALRGPDGSMMTATDGLYDERSSLFYCFAVGLANTLGCVTVCVWLILHLKAALCCMIIVLYTCRTIWINYKRVKRRFAFDEDKTVEDKCDRLPTNRMAWTTISTTSDSGVPRFHSGKVTVTIIGSSRNRGREPITM